MSRRYVCYQVQLYGGTGERTVEQLRSWLSRTLSKELEGNTEFGADIEVLLIEHSGACDRNDCGQLTHQPTRNHRR